MRGQLTIIHLACASMRVIFSAQYDWLLYNGNCRVGQSEWETQIHSVRLYGGIAEVAMFARGIQSSRKKSQFFV